MIRLVPINEIDTVWPQIAEAMASGYRKFGASGTVVDLHQRCRVGSDFLVVSEYNGGIQGAVVLDIRTDGTANFVALCGRDLDQWMPDLLEWPMLNAWGITRFVAECRVGFAERLKDIMPGIKVLRHVLEWSR